LGIELKDFKEKIGKKVGKKTAEQRKREALQKRKE
jgi:hypothetical protein